MTTGCTIEAHNFQRDLPKYDALNAVVLGVSLDTVESHKTFCTKDSLTFKLLADPDHKVIDAYGVPVTARGDNEVRRPRHLPDLARGQGGQGVDRRQSQHALRRCARRHRRHEWRRQGATQADVVSSRRKKARTSREESGPFCLPGTVTVTTSFSSRLSLQPSSRPSSLPSLLPSLLLS